MKTIRQRSLQLLRILATGAWLAFAGWLAIYFMPVSALLALLPVLARLLAYERTLLRTTSWLLGLVAIPLVGLPEYAAATNTLHCRSLGFQRVPASSDCTVEDVEEGRRIAREGGPLFTPRERLGVHGFNHLMALGGLPFGFARVSDETARMSWLPDPLAPEHGSTAEAPRSARLAQCTENAVGPTQTLESDFPLRSPRLRTVLDQLLPRLGDAPGSQRSREVHFLSGSSEAAWFEAWRQGELAAALALEVPDSTLTLTRRTDGGVDARWSGMITYPPRDVAFAAEIPTLWGPRVVRVSEAVFCGMQLDGAMSPYRLELVWPVVEG